MRQWGGFIVDNTLFKGEVIRQTDKSDYATGIEELNRLFFYSNKEFDISQITIGDGILVAIKK